MADTHGRAERQIAQLFRQVEILQLALNNQSQKIDSQHEKLVSVVKANALLLADQPIDQVLRGILDSALNILGAGAGSLMLKDPETDTLSIRVSTGLASGIAKAARPKVGEGIAGLVAKTGEPVLLAGKVVDPNIKAAALRDSIKDALVAPLTVNGVTIGVLSIRNSRGGGTFDDGDLELLKAFADQAAVAIEVARREEEVDRMYVDSVAALAEAVDARDSYTGSHSTSVHDWALRLGAKAGLSEDQLRELGIGAMLHDVGKIGVDDAVLRKPDRLTDEEFAQIKIHPILAVRILAPLGSRHDIIPMIRHHHERYDGRGYPAGLKGEGIPREARILALADSYHAMASERSYRAALSESAILREMEKGRGTQFDPELVDLFLVCLKDAEAEIIRYGPASESALADLAVAAEVRDRVKESVETVRDAGVKLSERLFEGLEGLVGSGMTLRLQEEVNARAAEVGLPYVIEHGSVKPIAGADAVVERIVTDYERFLTLHTEIIVEAIGQRLFDRLVEESVGISSDEFSFERYLLDRAMEVVHRASEPVDPTDFDSRVREYGRDVGARRSV